MIFFEVFSKKRPKDAAYTAKEEDSEENPGTFEISVSGTNEISADNNYAPVTDVQNPAISDAQFPATSHARPQKSLFCAFFMVAEPDRTRHHGYFNALATLATAGMAWIESISATGNGIRRWHVMRFCA